jgi:hypothetical protein
MRVVRLDTLPKEPLGEANSDYRMDGRLGNTDTADNHRRQRVGRSHCALLRAALRAARRPQRVKRGRR